MPRYYCDYCDTYLTHDSPSVRKQHNAGYKHKANVRIYYQQFEELQTQSLIDQRIKEHLGQAAALQQVGAAFNQHLMAQRPRLPVMPIPGAAPLPVNQPMVPGMRPPVLPRPVPGAPGAALLPVNQPMVPGMRPHSLPRPFPGAPGYISAPGMPPMMAPPGGPLPGQVNDLPRPPTLTPPTTVAGTATTPTSSNGAPTISAPYQVNPAAPTSGGFDNFNANAQPSEANH